MHTEFRDLAERAQLPPWLRERIRVIRDAAPTHGSHVLYWMHHAVRGHENPALACATALANHLERPLLVYQGLGGRHRFNSDRHHRFIIEGARAAAEELAEHGIRHVFYLGRNPDAPTPLTALAQDAAVVITEEFPAPPFPRWVERLAAQVEGPLWTVDATCIVPMQWLGKAVNRAYVYRERTWAEYERRLRAPFVEIPLTAPAHSARLPFEPEPLAEADLAELCAQCEIDHAIGPVPGTPGGSPAGYRRWERFKDEGLARYDRLRNDAAIAWPHGVSRLSPYLHHGHISALRIAREALAHGGRGAEKFLDELLIWRELSHHYCFHRSADLDSLRALPAWAQDSLAAHADDPRPALYSWETLARGRTSDPLWDAAQRSLLIHGELHNNVRMTWGKAIPFWTPDPEAARAMLVDLNHRYALDGNDPNSYGGLYSSLGLFTGKSRDEQAVLGAVKPRPTDGHLRRLDFARYSDLVTAPACPNAPRVAVIGAGIAGLACARALADHGLDVTVFEKSRGAGGRAATRRSDDYAFDHGAQYFTARDARFKRYVDAWCADGHAAVWDRPVSMISFGMRADAGHSSTRYVGTPGMSALGKHLAGDLRVHYQSQVGAVEPTRGEPGARWLLSNAREEALGVYDVVIVATPAPQAVPLLAGAAPELAERAGSVRMSPCITVIALFSLPLAVDFDAAFVKESPLAWIARNNSKPGRRPQECWVLHATAEWSERYVNEDREQVSGLLLDAFWEATGARPVEAAITVYHSWLLSRVDQAMEPPPAVTSPCLWDRARGVGACGDWCSPQSRIEDAFLSGTAMAGRVLGDCNA